MSTSPMIVYVVDDDPRLGEELGRLFAASNFQPTVFNTGQAFLQAYPRLRPGCLFVDLDMPGMSGLDLLQKLRAEGCRWPIVILAEHGSTVSAADVMGAGAFAFLEKPVRELEALATAHKAQAYLGGATQVLYDEEIARRIQRLPRRVREVFDHVIEGRLNKQIAGDLGISESTVKSARKALMDRLQATTSAELVMMALRGGLTIKSRS